MNLDNALGIHVDYCNPEYAKHIEEIMNDPFYNMTHKNRGRALIFNHKHFDIDNLSNRTGTDVDSKKLKHVLEQLHFDVSVYEDHTHDQLYWLVQNQAHQDHTDNDCILIVILSHGGEEYIYAKDKKYKLETIWNLFTVENCPTLKGKPKLFFIQACRGNQFDHGIMALIDKGSSPTVLYSEPVHTDFLIAYSTVPGFLSWRNPTRGSWFIQSLCDVLAENGKSFDILTLLTFVCQRVAVHCETNIPRHQTQHAKKQMPNITSMLTRQLYFPDKTT